MLHILERQINTEYFLQQHAKLCYDILKDVPGLIPTMPDGAMYMMVEIDKNCFQNMETTLEFVTKLMEEESVFCLPGEVIKYNM